MALTKVWCVVAEVQDERDAIVIGVTDDEEYARRAALVLPQHDESVLRAWVCAAPFERIQGI